MKKKSLVQCSSHPKALSTSINFGSMVDKIRVHTSDVTPNGFWPDHQWIYDLFIMPKKYKYLNQFLRFDKKLLSLLQP